MFADFDPSELRPALEQWSDPEALARLAEECRSRVSIWKWARGQMWRPEPHRRELYGTRDRWLSRLDWRKYDDLRHGLDDQGLIHFAEEWSDNGRRVKRSGAETGLIYRENELDAIHYVCRSPPARIQTIHRFQFKEGRLDRWLAIGRDFCSESRCIWNDGRLGSTLSVGWRHRFDHKDRSYGDVEATLHSRSTYTYTDQGRVKRIEKVLLNEDGSVNADVDPILIYTSSFWERMFRRSLIQ